MGRSYYYALFIEGLREAKFLPQNQTANKRISQDSNPGSLTTESFASLVTPVHQPKSWLCLKGVHRAYPPTHPIRCCPPWAQLVWTASIWTHDQWPSMYQPQLKPLQQWPMGICSHPSIQPQRALIRESATHHSKMGQVPEELWEGRQRKEKSKQYYIGYWVYFCFKIC